MAVSKPGPELEPREAQVLKAVVHVHTATGEPVSSREVAGRARIDLSPASIRQIMAALEERGLLVQPHTSAGRVPTDRAYRLYVDRYLPKPSVAPAQASIIDAAMARCRGEVQQLLGEASRQLSHISKQVGVVLMPEFHRVVVEHFEFARLEGRRVVAILVARSGIVHSRVLETEVALEQSELDRIGRDLTVEFGGHTLPEIQGLLRQHMTEQRAAYDERVARSLALGRQALESGAGEGELIVEGATNLVGSPEFEDPGELRALLEALGQKRRLVDLLSTLLDGAGVQVVIGGEHGDSELSRCSLIASPYSYEGRVVGTVGIVGPTRMAYAPAIALVDYLARSLTSMLSSSDN